MAIVNESAETLLFHHADDSNGLESRDTSPCSFSAQLVVFSIAPRSIDPHLIYFFLDNLNTDPLRPKIRFPPHLTSSRLFRCFRIRLEY